MGSKRVIDERVGNRPRLQEIFTDYQNSSAKIILHISENKYEMPIYSFSEVTVQAGKNSVKIFADGNLIIIQYSALINRFRINTEEARFETDIFSNDLNLKHAYFVIRVQ